MVSMRDLTIAAPLTILATFLIWVLAVQNPFQRQPGETIKFLMELGIVMFELIAGSIMVIHTLTGHQENRTVR